jgi:hypothetical protein
MPAETSRAPPRAPGSAPDLRRRSERRACSLAVVLHMAGRDCSATLTDLSPEGAGLQIDTNLALRPGMRLVLMHPRLGGVPGVLRWAMHPRYGIEFETSHHALARLRTLYESLSPSS